jgi:hypothetical protein
MGRLWGSGVIPDPERLRLTSKGSSSGIRPPRPVGGERFLRGPVPLQWLERAGRCPGKSLHVGIALWFRAGLTRRREIPLGRPDLTQFGVSRFAASRALLTMEQAGLITVIRLPGRKRLVTICHDPAPDGRPKSPPRPSDPRSRPETGPHPTHG